MNTDPSDRIVCKEKVIRVIAGDGYYPDHQGKTLCKLTNTGNGYIVKFPSHTSSRQDNFVCLDYAEAAVLYRALSVALEGAA